MEIDLPDGAGTVSARAISSGDSEIAVVCQIDPAMLARVDRVLDRLRDARHAA